LFHRAGHGYEHILSYLAGVSILQATPPCNAVNQRLVNPYELTPSHIVPRVTYTAKQAQSSFRCLVHAFSPIVKQHQTPILTRKIRKLKLEPELQPGWRRLEECIFKRATFWPEGFEIPTQLIGLNFQNFRRHQEGVWPHVVSSALTASLPRDQPRRENSPILTFAFVSSETRSVPASAADRVCTTIRISKIASVSESFFLRLRFADAPRAVPHSIQNAMHRTLGRNFQTAGFAELLTHRLGRDLRKGQRCLKFRIGLRLRICQGLNLLRQFRVLLFDLLSSSSGEAVERYLERSE